MRVIIAEDEAVVADILGSLLAERGHQVQVVNDGGEAWAAFDRKPSQLVISDWVMPGLTGVELCERIRTRPNTDYCYVIMLTAVTGDKNIRHAMDAGVDDFLMKPLDQDQLAVRLRVAERILSCMRKIDRLESLLPICSYCRRIRHEREWTPLESYISSTGGADFSHCICPDCMEKVSQTKVQSAG